MKDILVKDLVLILDDGTKIHILNLTTYDFKSLWEGVIDDIDFDNIPYGEHEVEHLTVINGEDILQVHIEV